MTNEQALLILKRIWGSYLTQRQRMTAEDVQGMTLAYVTGLRDLEHDAALAAVERIVRTSRFLPTIAEIREAAMDAVHGTRKNGGAAWGECLALIRRYGSHRHPGIDFEITDSHVAATVRAFGWHDLCRSDNSVADRARFIELYDQLAKGERKEAQIAPGLTLPAGPRTETRQLPAPRPFVPVDSAEARNLIAAVLTAITQPVTETDNRNQGDDDADR